MKVLKGILWWFTPTETMLYFIGVIIVLGVIYGMGFALLGNWFLLGLIATGVLKLIKVI